MKKGIIITAISLMLGLGFTACNNASLIGTWVEPAEENSTFGETGFTLEKDGTVVPINMGYREYSNWEKLGDKLILKGQYTGTNPRAFADTMWVDEVTKEHLVLKDMGNYSVTYQRKAE
ncbi:MAG: lipocalin family protein [Bacteroidales bacterium]|nr:lipocalin family protein [Bacteroidales bacterium]